MREYPVSRPQFQLETMNDDLTYLEELKPKAVEEFRKHMESGGHDVISAHRDLGDSLRGITEATHEVSASRSARETLFGIPYGRSTTIQAIQKISPAELMSIPEDIREEFLDDAKERALHGMIEQADLINAVSYETSIDPLTRETIVIAKLKVIIDE